MKAQARHASRKSAVRISEGRAAEWSAASRASPLEGEPEGRRRGKGEQWKPDLRQKSFRSSPCGKRRQDGEASPLSPPVENQNRKNPAIRPHRRRAILRPRSQGPVPGAGWGVPEQSEVPNVPADGARRGRADAVLQVGVWLLAEASRPGRANQDLREATPEEESDPRSSLSSGS